jgi:aspartyl-tRNA(Asn)/glutamyl-tRNA(Gln) amidotransferase subunit A
MARNEMNTIAEASDQIRRGGISPVELVEDCLEVIERLNLPVNAFITVTAETAMREARQAEAEIRAGRWRGPLHGIPVGLKDLIDTAGVPTTAGSAIFRDRIPADDAELVKKLKARGAILIGKQNLHEFAYGGSSVISHYEAVRNPVNPEFIAGGSSGGSAAAVAVGMCYAAIGTDTAGSIREPAALCGVVGLKPTFGLVSTEGIIPLSTSLDHAGPITRSVEDAAIVLDAITDKSLSCRKSLRLGMKDFRIGVPRKYFFEEVDPEILTAVERSLERFGKMGCKLQEVDLPVNEDRTVFLYEAHAYHRDNIASSPQLYDPETLRRVKAGADIGETQYRQARIELQRIRNEIGGKLQGVDVLLTPTTPVAAPKIADLMGDISRLRPAELLLLRNTRPINVWGLPAISVPCRLTKEGLPIGLQLAAAPGEDAKVLRAAYAYECSAEPV